MLRKIIPLETQMLVLIVLVKVIIQTTKRLSINTHELVLVIIDQTILVLPCTCCYGAHVIPGLCSCHLGTGFGEVTVHKGVKNLRMLGVELCRNSEYLSFLCTNNVTPVLMLGFA